MNKEIELKAWVDNPEKIKELLSSIYNEGKTVNKEDVYYRYPSGQLARLRKENGKNCVTLKRKNIEDGIEINDELEFSVDDGDAFLAFMGMTGAFEYIRKKKNGYRFLSGKGDEQITIELCEVIGLGWFIEIEKVIDLGDGPLNRQKIDEAQRQIKAALSAAGISEEKIEKRYYSDMLLERSR